jgi:superfamily II DNA or RNA helicase
MENKTKEFLQKLKDSGYWNDDYDYSKVEYIDAKTKVIVICKSLNTEHLLIPSNMLNRVNKCSIKNAINKKEFILETIKNSGRWKDDYDYSKIEYIDAKTKVIIYDENNIEHHVTPDSLINKKINLTIRSAVDKNMYAILKSKKFHKNRFGYSKFEYRGDQTYSIVTCNEHGDFQITPNNLWRGKGCPKCAKNFKMSFEKWFERYKKSEYYNHNLDFSEFKWGGTEKKSIVIDKSFNNSKHIITPYLLEKGSNMCSENAFNKTEYWRLKFEEVHKNKYGYSKFIFNGNDIKSTITCPKHGDFKQSAANHLKGQGCPVCNHGFTKSYKLKLIQELIDSDLLIMDPVELQIIIQQGALPNDFRPLINTDAESDERIATLRELQERYEFDDEPEEELEDIATAETASSDNQEEEELVEIDDVDGDITETEQEEQGPRLPSVNSIRDLHSLDNSIYASMDEEAFETLIQYKIRKYWNETLNGKTDISKLRKETGGKYFTSIKNEFLDEYDNVLKIAPADGYSFKGKDGNIAQPNLMQKLTVYRLLKNKYYGNWSGTGAGKTLSFILASRNMDARLTVVITLNSTVKQLCKEIKGVYPNSKCFTDYKEGHVFNRNSHNYLVLNYEKFQQENSENKFQSLTSNNQIDFVVIDEVHNAKQRTEDEESIRRGVMVRLLGRARENENLHILAMSATPVINNLFEAKSLLSLMSGLEYNDLQTRRTIGNAIKIFQQLTLNGLRFIPKYNIQINELTGRNMTNLSIDGSHLLNRLLELPQNDYIEVEKLILDDKLKSVTPYIRKGVIIYSYFTTGIINKIQQHVESLGFKVGTYTGDESSILRDKNLKDFISGNIDVLIGSRPIGTGVDGLQNVSNRMICVTLPWTDSEYTQLKGRIYRQGSEFDDVEIIIPQVRIQLEGGDVWSWDIQRFNLIKNKKTLADAAVDGVIPSNILPSKETMFRKSIESLKNWQDRVSDGNVVSSERGVIQMNLYPELNDEDRQRRINSELSEFNRRGKTLHSSTMHKEFTDNPDSWYRYHTLRKERMESWEEIPYEYIATKIKDQRDVVADFGCGENLFKNCIPNNKVHSFDHIAIDETVIACDMKNTGLSDESIDVAVFSLALWGTNSEDYIKEAYRVLRRKGMIYISEPSKNYETPEDQKKLINILNEIGFQQVGSIENRGKFIYLTGIKI